MTSCLQWDARAGEICDTYHQMGVPGAILSGYNAVDLMLNKTPH